MKMIVGFVNFLSLPSFRIGSIAHNKSPETPENFKSLKTLNLFVKPSNTLPKYDKEVILGI